MEDIHMKNMNQLKKFFLVGLIFVFPFDVSGMQSLQPVGRLAHVWAKFTAIRQPLANVWSKFTAIRHPLAKAWAKFTAIRQPVIKAIVAHSYVATGVAGASTLLAILGGVYTKQKLTDSQSHCTISQARTMSIDDWQNNLFEAATNGDIPTLKTLVAATKNDKFKDINAAGRDGWTALMLACKRGHTPAAALLLQNGARTDVSDVAMKCFSPLMLASDGGHLEIVNLLTNRKYNVPIDETDRWGRTAFMLACQKGHNNIVNQFLKRHVDIINQQDNRHSTPLIWAVEGGHGSTVELLLGAGANATLRSETHGTALELAQTKKAESGRMEKPQYEQIEALLKNAATNQMVDPIALS